MNVSKLSARDRASFGPRELKPEGSTDWCWQTVNYLKSIYRLVEERWHDVEQVVKELEATRAWEIIPPERPYGDEDTMLRAELGIGLADVRRTVLSAAERARKPATLLDHGGDRKSTDQGYGVTLIGEQRGNSADYRTARIARDAPDVIERMRAGEFESVAAAERAAGLARPDRRVWIAGDPRRAAEVLVAHFGRDFIRQLTDELRSATRDE